MLGRGQARWEQYNTWTANPQVMMPFGRHEARSGHEDTHLLQPRVLIRTCCKKHWFFNLISPANPVSWIPIPESIPASIHSVLLTPDSLQWHKRPYGSFQAVFSSKDLALI